MSEAVPSLGEGADGAGQLEPGAARATTGELMPRAGQRGPDVGGGIAATDAVGYSAPEGVDTLPSTAAPVGEEGGRDAGSGVQY